MKRNASAAPGAFTEPCGYYTYSGYMGRLPSGKWMLFVTQLDYLDYFFDDQPGLEPAS